MTGSPRATYDEGLAAGELRYQWCLACAAVVFYPRVLCPACGATELEWRRSTGRGAVYSVTTVARRDSASYNVALIDVDEGFRMMSTVVGGAADDVAIGDRVRVDFTELSGRPDAVFRKEVVA